MLARTAPDGFLSEQVTLLSDLKSMRMDVPPSRPDQGHRQRAFVGQSGGGWDKQVLSGAKTGRQTGQAGGCGSGWERVGRGVVWY